LAKSVKLMQWPSDLADHLANADVVISTLPGGAANQLAAQMMQRGGRLAGRCLLDVAYDPWPSQLAQVWQAGGGQVVSGLSMLLYQAAAQVTIMTGGCVAPLEAMRCALIQRSGSRIR
jgi:shikimate dehydrogenase